MQVTLFSRILTTLLRSGTTIVEAFTIASNSLSNRVYRRALHIISSSIQEGENVSTYLEKHGKLFSPLVTQMVSVGEETGKLDGSFEFIANFTEKELDEATKTLTTILEPLLMIFIGALVGLVAIAIITPIYSLTSSLQR
jgi:type IV pilus assembly protein PilC